MAGRSQENSDLVGGDGGSSAYGQHMATRLCVLISGNGSNLQAILDACDAGELAAEVVAVVSNTADAFGLERARTANVEAVHLTRLPDEHRRDYDTRLAQLVSSFQPELVVMAGFMHLLSNNFLQHIPCQVINLHPALPGHYPGLRAVERAFEDAQSGQRDHTGVMVHYVPDEGVDDGPPIATATVPIEPADTLQALTSRIHLTEHRLLVDALRTLTTSAE